MNGKYNSCPNCRIHNNDKLFEHSNSADKTVKYRLRSVRVTDSFEFPK